jgi:hypothetical protein
MRNLSKFPIEVNRADYEELLRVPGIGLTSARKIMMARKSAALTFDDLRKLGIALKRAVYFITCQGKYIDGAKFDERFIYHNLTAGEIFHPAVVPGQQPVRQLTFFDGLYCTGSEVAERYGKEAFSWESGSRRSDIVRQDAPVYLLPGAGDYQKACTGEL